MIQGLKVSSMWMEERPWAEKGPKSILPPRLWAPKGYLQTFAEGGNDESAGGGEGAGEGAQDGSEGSKDDKLTKEYIEKLIQSEVDRVRTKYTKELKAKEKELENFRTASMTAQEKAEYELQELQKQLAEREQVLLQKEMRNIAVDELTAAELDVAFIDFVVGKDAEDTKQRAETFKETFNKALEKAVEARFKAAGRDVFGGAGGGKVTFTKERVAGMSTAEINKHWSEIQADMKNWK